jgi:hypothetical protein
MIYVEEWLVQMCATAGGRAEVLRLLAEPNHFKDIVFGRGPDVRFPQMCQDCVVQGDINGIAERLKQAERRVEETNRIIDGICAAYDTGVEPNPEHFPFAAKVAELRHEVNDLRTRLKEADTLVIKNPDVVPETRQLTCKLNTDDFTEEEEARLLENVKKSTADICGMQYAARKLNFDKEQYDKFKETSMGCLVPEPPPCSICGETPKKRSLTQIIRDKLVELKPVLDANPLPQPRTLGIFINDVVHGFAGSCKPMGHDVYYLIDVISDCPLNDAIFEIHYDSKVMLKNVCHVNSRGYVFDDGTYLYEEMEVLATKADAVIQTITTTPEGRSVGTPPAMMPCSACAAQGFCSQEESRDGAPCRYFDAGPEPTSVQDIVGRKTADELAKELGVMTPKHYTVVINGSPMGTAQELKTWGSGYCISRMLMLRSLGKGDVFSLHGAAITEDLVVTNLGEGYFFEDGTYVYNKVEAYPEHPEKK